MPDTAKTKSAEQFLLDAMDGIEDGAAVYDAENRLVYFNRSYAQYFHHVSDILRPGVTFQKIMATLAERETVAPTQAGRARWVAHRLRLFSDGELPNEFQRDNGAWVRVDYHKLSCGGTFAIATDVSEQKRAEIELQTAKEEVEAALRKSETLHRHGAHLAHLGYWEWGGPDWKLLWCTEEYARIFEMSVDEIYAASESLDSDLELVHPDDRERYERYTHEFLQSLGYFQIEYRIITRSGAVRHVLELGEAQVDAEGRLTRSLGILQDITERKQAEQALKESHDQLESRVKERTMELRASESQLRHAAHTVHLGHWRFDEVNQTYVSISEEYARIFGYSVDEFLTRFRTLDEDIQLAHPDDRERLLKAYERGGELEIDYRIFRADGAVRHVREIQEASKDDAGALVEAVGTLQDITELKETQARLAESERRFRNLIEGSIEGIIIHQNFKPLFVNRAYAEMHGYTHTADVLDMPSVEVFAAPEERARLRQIHDAHLNGQDAVLRYEYAALARDDTPLVLECMVRPVNWDGVLAVQNTVVDVTARKRAETEMLSHARRQRDALVREVHHRIKNNLQGVVGLLNQSRRGNTDAEQALEIAQSQIRAIAVVHGLQAQAGDETISAAEVVRSIALATGSSFSEEVEISEPSSDENGVRLAEAEAVPLALIINELLTNACKHHRRVEAEPRVVSVDVRIDRNAVEITIRNTTSELPEGFDFNATKGLGSGLDLVKALMPRDGAELSITRDGSRITTCLSLLAPSVLFDEQVVAETSR